MLAAGALRAESASNAYDFLDIPTSSRAYALGSGAIAVVDGGVTLADSNPALIGPEMEKDVAFSYMHYMASGNFAGVRYGQAVGERGAWAAGIRYLGYGKMTQWDASGVSGGEFSPSDIVFEGTYSRDITDRWRGGINLNVVYSHYGEYTAWAMGVDLGVNYYNDEKDLSFSVVLKNMGGQLKRFNTTHEPLPFDIQLGYMQGLGSSPFSLAITAAHLTRWRMPYYTHPKDEAGDATVEKSTFFSNFFRHLTFGLQFQPSERFYLALGYDYKTATDMAVYHRNILSGFSVGGGIGVKGFNVGVAFAMPHKSAATLMLNLGYNFADLLN